MSTPVTRPNLLLIMADQHRADWLGCEGASWARTPNLDRLAARGTLFSQAICNSPLCAPSRISLASGMQPHRLGARDNSAFYPLSVPTYYQALRDAGYRVSFVGKIDLHKPDPFNGRHGNLPITYTYGFTDPHECEGKMHAGTGWPRPHGPYNHYLAERGLLQKFCEDYHRRRFDLPVWYAADSVLPAEHCEDSYIGRWACQFIENAVDESPWHLFVSFVGPHDPWDPPTEYADHFRGAPMPEPIADSLQGKPAWQQQRAQRQAGATAEEVASVRRQYTASIELIDDAIGQILQSLEKRGQADNTYIVYCSDHGEMLGDHGFYEKSMYYEPSLRVPLIAVGPDIAANARSDALIELSDLNPTLLELAGLSPRPGLDARSIAPLLRGETHQHRDFQVSTIDNALCLRTRQHKYVANINDRPELYDLETDPHELHNLAPEQPQLARELHRALIRAMNGN
ncbi:MAG TPA: sulfatase-like hydrolase/transferase [Chloroflexota bacterium]|nr:sulfatase-like hydrolase/transferase [Chloroflexota bacterium]